MAMAELVARWSKDPSTQVGAVIVDPVRNCVLGTGYNGLARGVEDSEYRLRDRDTKYAMTTHAEVNALINSALWKSLHGSTLYVTPLPPCSTCAGILVGVGIRRVVWRNHPNPLTAEKWVASAQLSATIFGEAGVIFEELKYED